MRHDAGSFHFPGTSTNATVLRGGAVQSSFRDSMCCSTISASISSGSEIVALVRTEICLFFTLEFFIYLVMLLSTMNTIPHLTSSYLHSFPSVLCVERCSAHYDIFDGVFFYTYFGNQHFPLPWINTKHVTCGLFLNVFF